LLLLATVAACLVGAVAFALTRGGGSGSSSGCLTPSAKLEVTLRGEMRRRYALRRIAIVRSPAYRSVYFVAAVVASPRGSLTVVWSTPDRDGSRGVLAVDPDAAQVAKVLRAPFSQQDIGYSAAIGCLRSHARRASAVSVDA
jgi:hypothetical protein